MLVESLAWLRARSDRVQRKLGYVSEAVALNARYVRCQSAWQSHLELSQRFIVSAIKQCHAHRHALILGAGNCLDVPLDELSAAFERVILVDAVKLAQTETKIKRYQNVDFCVHDITEVNRDLISGHELASLQQLSNTVPRKFINDNKIDLVVSLNLLSQLPLLPMRYLRSRETFSDDEINAIGLNLMRVHCRYLQQFDATRVLIFDAEQWQEDALGQRHESLCLQQWLNSEQLLPASQLVEEWQWTVAPAGEQAEWSTQHRVQALLFAR